MQALSLLRSKEQGKIAHFHTAANDRKEKFFDKLKKSKKIYIYRFLLLFLLLFLLWQRSAGAIQS